MALALYRKYRPRTFAEVIGQEHVTEPLMQAIRTGRLHHAYLFSGPRGCGKTSSARILARSLNCAKGPTPEPCGECDSCVALAPDGPGSIDVIEIDAASHGGVDDARDLRERAFFAPVASRFKVYIIDEAHMVSTQGFNALLKLVEEPPEYVKFVFATTEPEKVLGTIRSRTHHYPFRLVPPSVLRPYLEKLCHAEGVSVEPAVFPLVVRTGGGSVRDSLSVLDQLIAGAGVYGVTYTRAVELLGVTDVALIDEMADALAAGDGAAAFSTIDRLVEAGHDPRRFTGDLLERLRDLIILQRVPDAAGSGIIDAPADQLERMTAQASRMGPATLSRLADIAHNGLTEMRGTTAPRLVLELIIARMLLPGAGRLARPPCCSGWSGWSAASVRQKILHRYRAEPARPAPVVGGGAGRAAAGSRATAPGRPRLPRPRWPPHRPAEPAAPIQPPPAAGGAQAGGRRGPLDAAAVRRVWDEVLTGGPAAQPEGRGPWSARRWCATSTATRSCSSSSTRVHVNMFGAQAELLTEAVREVLRWHLAGPGRAGRRRGGPRRPAAGPAPGRAGPAGPGEVGRGPGVSCRSRRRTSPTGRTAGRPPPSWVGAPIRLRRNPRRPRLRPSRPGPPRPDRPRPAGQPAPAAGPAAGENGRAQGRRAGRRSRRGAAVGSGVRRSGRHPGPTPGGEFGGAGDPGADRDAGRGADRPLSPGPERGH